METTNLELGFPLLHSCVCADGKYSAGHLLLGGDFIAKHYPNPLSLEGLLLWAELLLPEKLS